jgi:hypothetical protein
MRRKSRCALAHFPVLALLYAIVSAQNTSTWEEIRGRFRRSNPSPAGRTVVEQSHHEESSVREVACSA